MNDEEDPVFEAAMEELERSGQVAIRTEGGWAIAIKERRLEELLAQSLESDDGFVVLHVQRPPDA